MTKAWNDMTPDERNVVFEKLARVYEEAGHPANLKPPTSAGEYVNILMAKEKQNKCHLTITGEFGPDESELADSLSVKIKEACNEVSDAKVSISCKRGVGAPMGVIKNVNKVFEDGECNVEHKEGQVLLLDFWATWCPPCQRPMAHNQEMLVQHGEKWGDRVRLIGLSIDQTAATVKNHVETKGWTKVEHYHVRNGKCVADKEFGVQGVPHVALVDTTGKIVFVGHPASRPDLEGDIDKLLAGEVITGKGTTAAAGGDDEEDGPFEANVDAEKVDDAVAKFLKDSEEILMTDTTKEAASGMPRAFCVLVHEARFDCKTKTLANKMDNYHVLVGPQAKIDGMKTILQPFNDGPWKVVLREHAL